MEIISFIASHWVEWLFTIAVSFLGYGYRVICNKLKAEQIKNEAISEGVQALLRESIVTSYNKYMDKGYCPIYAKESLKRAYKAYSALGGNDVATQLYHNLLLMKEEPQENQTR